MKCGKEIGEGAVFCESCIAVMKQYPVKPGTPVLLPQRLEPQSAKKTPTRKKAPTAEEQLTKARRSLQWLGTALAVTLLLLFFALFFIYESWKPTAPDSNIGQNYNTISAEDSTN